VLRADAASHLAAKLDQVAAAEQAAMAIAAGDNCDAQHMCQAAGWVIEAAVRVDVAGEASPSV
jgi:hypothetical protein